MSLVRKGGKSYTPPNSAGLPVVVQNGESVRECQVLASNVTPIVRQALQCSGDVVTAQLAKLLSSNERTLRFTGVKLARFRSEPAFAGVIEALADDPHEDMYVRLEAAVYLTRVIGHPVQARFNPYLSHIDHQNRLEAVIALASVGNDEAVAVLSQLLHDKSARLALRSAAAWSLGQIGSGPAAEELSRAFADVSLELREEALLGLCSLKPELPSMLQHLTGPDANIAAGCAEALRRQGNLDPETIALLVVRASSPERPLWATWLLGQMPHDYVKTAVASLQDSHPDVHYAIAVLWSFVESWIARNWEVHPNPGA